MEHDNTGETRLRSWAGFWSGVIWFLIGFILILSTQVGAVVILGIIESIQYGGEITEERIDQLFTDGESVGIAFILLLPLLVMALAFAIKIRRKRFFFEYLAFNKVTIKSLILWLTAAFLLLVAFEYISQLFERPVPEWVMTTYKTTDNYFVLFVGMVIFGPFCEEILFRGYIYRAWAESIIGPYAGCILLSILWAAIHMQYELFEMTMIFALGLLLGWSRLKSGSLYPPIVIHVFWNLASFIHLEQFVST